MIKEWKLPEQIGSREVIERRYKEINNFERYLAENGTIIMKFYLHLSKEKQREKMLNYTSTEWGKWYIIPGNNRWYARFLVASLITKMLKEIHEDYPRLKDEQERELNKAREVLEKEKQNC
jgi:polyphosphate kinase 2 (PPK2 family)